METKKTAIIFPAFVSEYLGIELQAIKSSENNFRDKISVASGILKTDLAGFDFLSDNFLADELKSQYISYIYSCTVADILKEKQIKPSFVCGYSMGLYAALYYCGAVNFQNGLLLVKRAWDAISGACLGGSYGMGMIIGLDEAEIRSWCDEQKDAWICNQNNPHTFIISGTLKSVSLILDKAKAEGALRTNLLPVSKPYHSQLLGKAKGRLQDFLGTTRFDEPVYPYFSCLDNKMIVKGSGFRDEVARNIDSHMNWLLTMDHLISLGTAVFFECGAGDGLTRNFRFIGGNYKAFSINNLQDFIAYLKANQESYDIPPELDLP